MNIDQLLNPAPAQRQSEPELASLPSNALISRLLGNQPRVGGHPDASGYQDLTLDDYRHYLEARTLHCYKVLPETDPPITERTEKLHSSVPSEKLRRWNEGWKIQKLNKGKVRLGHEVISELSQSGYWNLPYNPIQDSTRVGSVVSQLLHSIPDIAPILQKALESILEQVKSIAASELQHAQSLSPSRLHDLKITSFWNLTIRVQQELDTEYRAAFEAVGVLKAFERNSHKGTYILLLEYKGSDRKVDVNVEHIHRNLVTIKQEC